jgi:hypothetical protein
MTVLILDSSRNILFNSSDVNNTNIPHKVNLYVFYLYILPVIIVLSNIVKIQVAASNLTWTWYREPIGPTLNGTTKNPSPVEQLAISQYVFLFLLFPYNFYFFCFRDQTDYVWYSAEVNISSPGGTLNNVINYYFGLFT